MLALLAQRKDVTIHLLAVGAASSAEGLRRNACTACQNRGLVFATQIGTPPDTSNVDKPRVIGATKTEFPG